ncbi:MAG: HAD family hydrolase [Desulfobacterota bacterium]|nr:HAD family hydrolase [Thermodesulfobacteriota bacterium]MDW8002317.1 HAD family hydrolase [Deltaproteobacteria bacterium]
MVAEISLQCVIYDCDGVMFDSLEANRRLYNHIAKSLGREELSDYELQYCHTHTVQESLKFLFRDQPQEYEKAYHFLKNNVNLSDFVTYLRMEPNLLETLSILKRKCVKTAVCTNRTTTMKHIMDRYDLWPYFDIVVTALDVKNPKPNPESVMKILAELKVEKEKTVFVGDSEIDRMTAYESGVRFISYKNPNLAADAVIEDHLDLILLFFPNESLR